MHILVTGATGKVGSRTAEYLARRHSVRLLVRDPAHQPALQSRGFEVALGDVTQPERLRMAVSGIDGVAHFAAFFRGATVEQMDAVNRGGTIALARACLGAGVRRFVFPSTSLVYGPGSGRANSEDDPTRPQFPYPMSKLAAETELIALRPEGLNAVILRLAFVYGDGDPHLREFAPRLRQRPGRCLFHLVHHEDVARATELALAHDGACGKIFNVADDEPLPIRDTLHILGEPLSNDDRDVSKEEQWDDVLDTKRIRAELNFVPAIRSLRDAIASNRA
jgi:nucleoside-diphosphate-sugar epimerase